MKWQQQPSNKQFYYNWNNNNIMMSNIQYIEIFVKSKLGLRTGLRIVFSNIKDAYRRILEKDATVIAWKRNFPSFVGNYDRPTNRPSNQPTNIVIHPITKQL